MLSFLSLKSLTAPIGQVITWAWKVKSAAVETDFITTTWHELHAWRLFYLSTQPTRSAEKKLRGGLWWLWTPDGEGNNMTFTLSHKSYPS